MSTKITTLAAAAFAVAYGLIAPVHAADLQGAPTRAEVRAELDAARASGELHAIHSEDSGSAWLSRQPQAQATTRQAARESAIAAGCSGMRCAALMGEDSGSFVLSAQAASGPASRAQVKAELMRAIESGELAAMYGEDSGSVLLSRRTVNPTVFYAAGNTAAR